MPRHVRVWLILAEVTTENIVNTIGLTVGSKASIQCFIPTPDLALAMRDCDRLLEREGYRRVEIVRYAPFDPGEDYPDAAKFVIDDVNRARESGEALLGTFFTDRESASYQNPPDDFDPNDDSIKIYAVRSSPISDFFQRLLRKLRGWLAT